MDDLPQELLDELGGQLSDERKYTAHDHVLAYIADAIDGAGANEILVYLYYAQDRKVTKRSYLYSVLSRLRKADLIMTSGMSNAHGKALNFATDKGIACARPVIGTPNKKPEVSTDG